MTGALALALLLSLFPHVLFRACIEARAAQIARTADASTVPAPVLLTVALMESHFGCHPASGGCWGAPADPQHRHDAGTPSQAAHALATGFRVCGTWEGAVGRFRSGLCRPTTVQHRRYVRTVLGLVEAVYTRGGVAVPTTLRGAP